MKRMLVFVLAIVMVMSMAVPAAALASPTAKAENLVPVLTEEGAVVVELHTVEDVLELDEEVQEVMAEAKAGLKDVCPEGFAVKYFFYVEIIGSETSVSVEFEPIHHNEVVFKQFVDGNWVELEFTVNADKTITVNGVVEGPMAVFVK